MARIRTKIAGIVMLAGVLAAPAAIMAQAPGRVPDVNLRAATRPDDHERHTTMQRALAQLERTREMLRDDAAHDFHGHRKSAIHHIDGAIRELREGMRSDRD